MNATYIAVYTVTSPTVRCPFLLDNRPAKHGLTLTIVRMQSVHYVYVHTCHFPQFICGLKHTYPCPLRCVF